MLEASAAQTCEAQTADDAVVLISRLALERMQAELRFENTRNEALNFEVARLRRWRFGSSAESLDTSTQAVLFDRIVVDTALEDRAAEEQSKPAPAAPPTPAKRKAVRQALPASLPRIDHHHEIEHTHCACGARLERIGEELSEQLDCVPAQFFVLRHIRGKYACACCQTIQAAPMPAQIITKGSRPRGCWRRWWWPSTTIICRCIGKKRSTGARACTSRARAWRSGWVCAAYALRRWPKP